MWTPATRKYYSRPTQRYQTDMTEREWRVIEPYLPPAKPTGRPRAWPMRPFAPLADGLGADAVAFGQHDTGLAGAGIGMDLQHRSGLPGSGLVQGLKSRRIPYYGQPDRIPTMFRDLTLSLTVSFFSSHPISG